MNAKSSTKGLDVVEWWADTVEASIPFWKAWGIVSESQKRILENYRMPFSDEFQRMFQLAPRSLNQTINPWSFSLLQFTQQVKSSNPAAEYKIVRDVAGYGSQLGTIMDFLNVLEKVCEKELGRLKDPQDVEAIEKFRLLRLQIENAKNAADVRG